MGSSYLTEEFSGGMTPPLILFIFLVSAVAALIYEVVKWYGYAGGR